jgi:hypothetical protein
MRADSIPPELARRVPPRAMRAYAAWLGLKPAPSSPNGIEVFFKPDEPNQQIIVPLDEDFDDYNDMVSVAVERLAGFDKQPALDVLDHLLLPPADLFEFRDTSPNARGGTLSLDQAANLVNGIRKAFTAQAHSVLKPQSYHPRMGRNEATAFVESCRFGQTRRKSFAMTLACPLDAVQTKGQLLQKQNPFAREVTTSLMKTLAAIKVAADTGIVQQLLDIKDHPYMSANLCDAIVLMRPDKDNPSFKIRASWSRAMGAPDAGLIPSEVRLESESFNVAESLSLSLKAQQAPEVALFVGYVDVLRGAVGPDGKISGEVRMSLLNQDESLRARADLAPDHYRLAGAAHLAHKPIVIRAELHRMTRVNRLDNVELFQLAAETTEE